MAAWTEQLLGMFVKLQKAVISFLLSVRLSVHMEPLGSHWPGSHAIRYLRIFQKSFKKLMLIKTGQE